MHLFFQIKHSSATLYSSKNIQELTVMNVFSTAVILTPKYNIYEDERE